MEPRIDYAKYALEAQRALYALEKYIATCGLDHKLIHLLKMRASQINGCAFCIDMHSKDARALEWVESLTLVSETHVPDESFAAVKRHFSEKEIVDLTLVASMINLWNRVAISMRTAPGTYKVKQAGHPEL